jgi:hypothetical protein
LSSQLDNHALLLKTNFNKSYAQLNSKHLTQDPLGHYKTGLPTTLCKNVFPRKHNHRQGFSLKRLFTHLHPYFAFLKKIRPTNIADAQPAIHTLTSHFERNNLKSSALRHNRRFHASRAIIFLLSISRTSLL